MSAGGGLPDAKRVGAILCRFWRGEEPAAIAAALGCEWRAVAAVIARMRERLDLPAAPAVARPEKPPLVVVMPSDEEEKMNMTLRTMSGDPLPLPRSGLAQRVRHDRDALRRALDARELRLAAVDDPGCLS